MGDVINLKEPTQLADKLEFISDCCRYRENILSEAAVKKKWKFDAATWDRLGDDDELIRAIEAESVRRIRTGQQKREKSQQLITKAPAILDSIATDASASPRFRVDAIKTLNSFTGDPQEGAPANADRFIISIVLGDSPGDTLTFNKSLAIDAREDDPAPVNHRTTKLVGNENVRSLETEPVDELSAAQQAALESLMSFDSE